MSCAICDRVESSRRGENPAVVHEFKHGLLVLGDHQFFEGYCLLLLKEHAREIHELAPDVQRGLFEELMISARAIAAAFKPRKMNYSCYGNQDPHVHWHLVPRYESDPQHRSVPWVHSAEFASHVPDEATRRERIARLRAELKRG